MAAKPLVAAKTVLNGSLMGLKHHMYIHAGFEYQNMDIQLIIDGLVCCLLLDD